MGELVILLDCPLSHEGRWPMGRVVRLDAGLDGIPRSAAVQVGKEIYDRHLKSLAPLFEEEPGPPPGLRN